MFAAITVKKAFKIKLTHHCEYLVCANTDHLFFKKWITRFTGHVSFFEGYLISLFHPSKFLLVFPSWFHVFCPTLVLFGVSCYTWAKSKPSRLYVYSGSTLNFFTHTDALGKSQRKSRQSICFLAKGDLTTLAKKSTMESHLMT